MCAIFVMRCILFPPSKAITGHLARTTRFSKRKSAAMRRNSRSTRGLSSPKSWGIPDSWLVYNGKSNPNECEYVYIYIYMIIYIYVCVCECVCVCACVGDMLKLSLNMVHPTLKTEADKWMLLQISVDLNES